MAAISMRRRVLCCRTETTAIVRYSRGCSKTKQANKSLIEPTNCRDEYLLDSNLHQDEMHAFMPMDSRTNRSIANTEQCQDTCIAYGIGPATKPDGYSVESSSRLKAYHHQLKEHFDNKKGIARDIAEDNQNTAMRCDRCFRFTIRRLQNARFNGWVCLVCCAVFREGELEWDPIHRLV